MICDNCKQKQASVGVIVSTQSGKSIKRNLCSECLARRNKNIASQKNNGGAKTQYSAKVTPEGYTIQAKTQTPNGYMLQSKTQTSNGYMVTKYQEKSLGVDLSDMAINIDDMGVDMKEMLTSFNPILGAPTKKQIKRCSFCGMSSNDFVNSGFVGCGNCYKDLREQIMPLVKKVQGDNVHRGKVPIAYSNAGSTRSYNSNSLNDEYAELLYNLDQARKTGNYAKEKEIQQRLEQIKGDI